MLPSTGLFKSINCPYYETNLCNRYYCHYKHSKKDEEQKITKAAVVLYNPTPKSILEADKKAENLSTKQTLEYVPKSSKKENSCNGIYIPRTTVITATTTLCTNVSKENNFNIDLNGCEEEFDLISEIINSENDKVESKLCQPIVYVPTQIVTPMSDEINLSETDKNIGKQEEQRKETDNKSQKSVNAKSSRSTSSHSSSSKKYNESNSVSKGSSRSKSSRHSSSRHSKSIRSEKSSNSSHHHKTSSSRQHKSNGHSKKSSSSSSSNHLNKTKVKDKSESKPNVEISDNEFPETVSPSSVFDTDSDEDEIMKQCKMIFEEEFTAANVQNETLLEDACSRNDTKKEDGSLIDETTTKRKRVAHENVKNVYVKQVAPSAPKSRHLHNAMQSILMRQNLVKQQLETAKEKERVAAEEKVLSITKTNSLTKMDNISQNNHKIVTKSQIDTQNTITAPNPPKHTNSSTLFSKPRAVSNVIALQNAKKKN